MVTGLLTDRYGSFRYLIEIDGVTRGAFGYCKGLGGEKHVDYFIGDDAIDLVDVADPGHEAHLVLAQGFAFDDTLPEWEQAAELGHPERHDATIIQIDSFGRILGRWRFRGAWPVACEFAGSLGGPRQPAIDTLELAYDEIRRA